MTLEPQRPEKSIVPPPPAWIVAREPVPYDEALAFMEARAAAIFQGTASECVWLLEHPPLYTAGTSADPAELVDPDRFPIFQAGRGGRYTYHGPGQRVAYVMLNLNVRGRDVRAFVSQLEDWLIASLVLLGVQGEKREGAVGIFVGEAKVASIGIRIRRWVTFHGVSLNVSPNLEHFSGIIPCGLHGTPVTSLEALGAETDREKVDLALKRAFEAVFDTEGGQ